jgi:predicted PurR-regulated permease PerM
VLLFFKLAGHNMQVATSKGKIVYSLQLIFFSSAVLYFGKTLFVPLFFGLLTAIVLFPVCRWFERRKVSRPVAISICLIMVGLLLAALFLLLAWQLKIFSKDAPFIIGKAGALLHSLQKATVENFGITTGNNWGEKFSAGAMNIIASFFDAASGTMFILFLMPVYTALFLYHRHLFIKFLRMVTPGKYKQQLDEILHKTVHTYFGYIKGMMMVYIIVGLLNSIGLLALGVRHAFLFGLLCAVMTMVPYIGIIVSALLPISVVWMDTGNIMYPIGVVGVFSLVQYLEANVIFPKVVGTQLHVGTFAILVSVVAGGIIWGVAGMVLFIPFAAILKIVSEHIEELKPLNILLGRK